MYPTAGLRIAAGSAWLVGCGNTRQRLEIAAAPLM
jgi:hypothetical protein